MDQIPDTLEGEEHVDPVMTWGLIGVLVASYRRMDGFPAERAKHSEKIRNICAGIDSNLNQSEKLDDLAQRFGMSRTLLTREFRKYTGTSIVNYVNSRRLQNAGTALMSPGKSVLEVSLEHGFASLANFYKQFKSLYGIHQPTFEAISRKTPALVPGKRRSPSSTPSSPSHQLQSGGCNAVSFRPFRKHGGDLCPSLDAARLTWHRQPSL